MNALGRQAARTFAPVCGDNAVLLAKGDHIFEELKHIRVFFLARPVEPRGYVVLTIGVVVAELGVAKFVSGKEQRGSTAAHKRGKGILDQLSSERVDLGIVGFALAAAVPAVVVI